MPYVLATLRICAPSCPQMSHTIGHRSMSKTVKPSSFISSSAWSVITYCRWRTFSRILFKIRSNIVTLSINHRSLFYASFHIVGNLGGLDKAVRACLFFVQLLNLVQILWDNLIPCTWRVSGIRVAFSVSFVFFLAILMLFLIR